MPSFSLEHKFYWEHIFPTGCLYLCFRVLPRFQDVWFRPCHPWPWRGWASIHPDRLQSTSKTFQQVFFFILKLITTQILDNWSFNDRLPCHGVTRFPGVLKPRHSETGGGGWEGGLLLQLLVPHLLPAAFWHWYGWCEKQVFSMSSCKKSKHLPYSQVDVQHVTSAWEILSSASHQTQVPLIGSLERKL